MPSSATLKNFALGFGIFLAASIVGYLATAASNQIPSKTESIDSAEHERVSAILPQNPSENPASELRRLDRLGMEPSDEALQQLVLGLDLDDAELAKFVNALTRPLRNRAWVIAIRQRLLERSAQEVYALAKLSRTYGIDSENRPQILVFDAALASDPESALQMVRGDAWAMGSLLNRYAKIDPQAALAASQIELSGTPAMLESRQFFIFDLIKEYPEQFSPSQLANALPRYGDRMGNVFSLTGSAAKVDYDATLAWAESMENSILRNCALARIAGTNREHVWELLPRLTSENERNSAIQAWGRGQAREEGMAALGTALQLDDPHHRHAALSGVISELSLRQTAELVTEVVRATAADELPDQIWDLLGANHDFAPAAILAEDPKKRPHWLGELTPETRKTLELEARKLLEKSSPPG